MHILEKHFGSNFFDDLEKEVGFKVIKPSDTHFEITMDDNQILDFSVYEKQNVLIIGFPFSTIGKRKRVVQYREYVKFCACSDIDRRYINAVKNRVVRYNNGEYKDLASFE